MRCASDSSNGGLLGVLLHMSCSLSSRRFSIVLMRVHPVYVVYYVMGLLGVGLARICWLDGCLGLG